MRFFCYLVGLVLSIWGFIGIMNDPREIHDPSGLGLVLFIVTLAMLVGIGLEIEVAYNDWKSDR